MSLESDDFVSDGARGSSWSDTISTPTFGASTGLTSSMMVSSMMYEPRRSVRGVLRRELIVVGPYEEDGRSGSQSLRLVCDTSSAPKFKAELSASTIEIPIPAVSSRAGPWLV